MASVDSRLSDNEPSVTSRKGDTKVQLPKRLLKSDEDSAVGSSETNEIKLNFNNEESMDSPTKRDLLKKLAKLCGVTFFANISTIESDLEEYVKEILEDATNQSHHIEIRKDGVRAGEDITIYDNKTKTMFHTAFSRLSRKEITAMLNLVSKFDKKGKYSSMRILPHSVKEIQDALERAKNGTVTSASKSPMTKMSFAESTTKSVTSAYEPNLSPYGKFVRDMQASTGYDQAIKDKYYSKDNDSEDEEEKKKLMEKNKANKLKREYEYAEQMNNLRLKQFIKKQERLKKADETDRSEFDEKFKLAVHKKGNF